VVVSGSSACLVVYRQVEGLLDSSIVSMLCECDRWYVRVVMLRVVHM
jgi:hypothetical protein